MREQSIVDLEALVKYLAAEIQPYVDKPFAFYGHSMGALVAYETVRELRRTGRNCPRFWWSRFGAPELNQKGLPSSSKSDEEFIERWRKWRERLPRSSPTQP